MRSICLILMLGFCSIVDAKSTYKVDTLISMMLKNHPTIQAQKFAIQGADAQVKGAKWGYYPSLSLQVNQEFNQKKAWDETVTLSQPLWTGGKLDAQYDMALANRDKSKSALSESEYTLVSTLLSTLEKYMKNKANTKTLLEGKNRLITLKKMLSKRVSAGVSSESDQALLDTRLYQSETDIQQASTSMQTALAQIALYTGHNFDKSLSIGEGMKHEFGSLDSLIHLMEKTHPTLKKYDAMIANAKAEKSKTKATLFPNVSVNLQQGLSGKNSYHNTTDDTKVYLSVDASLGSGLSTLSKIEQAQAKVMQLMQEKLSAKQDLINKMILAYNSYISSSKRIQSQSGSIASSQKVFESYKRLFLRGKRAWLDLVNASRELRQNQVVLNNTKATRLISAYTLLLLSGKSTLQAGLK